MKRAIYSIFAVSILSMFCVMADAQTKVSLKVGDKTMTATLADNAATRELTALLEKGPVTVEMEDYGDFEKVGELPQSFTTSNSQITTTAGDIMLYLGRNIVIFYGSNSWSYTRLGKIDGATPENVRAFLGSGDVRLELSLPAGSGVEEISEDISQRNITDVNARLSERDEVYDLNGRTVTARPLPPGLYIINGRKTLLRP